MSLEQAVSALLSRLDAVQNRLNEVEKQLASGAAPSGGASAGAASSGEVAPFVAEYDALLSQHIKPLVALTQKIGSAELKNQVSLLEKALDSQKQFLAVASVSKKPDQNALNQLLAPTSKLIEEIVSIREKNRPSKQFNHLSTISEGISALGWVAVSPTPGPFVNEARASSEFYSNKILVEFKKLGADGHDNVEWVNHWNTWMKDLAAYIKKFHTTELTWNPRGGDASSAKVAAPAAGGAPPPPKAPGPPPPLPPPAAAAASGPSSADAQAALFASLNKGEGITSGLKKVTSDMKSKNRTDKTSVVPATSAPAKAAPAKAGGAAKKGTPKLELQGNKWLVEFQDNNKNIEIKETEAKQTIYVYKTDNAFVRVHGKVNSIALDGCKKTAIVFDTAIAQCELVNSTGIELQVTGKVPSIAVDSCSGIQIFLSKDSLETEIVTSKSDTMNVLVPGSDGSDPVELPIPEQYKTLYKGGKLVTQSVEHV